MILSRLLPRITQPEDTKPVPGSPPHLPPPVPGAPRVTPPFLLLPGPPTVAGPILGPIPGQQRVQLEVSTVQHRYKNVVNQVYVVFITNLL